MKYLIVFLSLSFVKIIAAQNRQIDRLKHELMITNRDTSKVLLYALLCSTYIGKSADSSLFFGHKSLELAKKINFLKGEARALNELGFSYRIVGDIPKSLELQYKGFQIAEKNHYHYEVVSCLRGIGVIYLHELEDYPKAIYYFKKQLQEVSKNPKELPTLKRLAYLNLGNSYKRNNQLKPALFYLQKALDNSNNQAQSSPILYFYGDLQFQLGNHKLAFEYLRKSIFLIQQDKEYRFNNNRAKSEAYTIISKFFKATNQPDSCIYYAKLGLATAKEIDYKSKVLENANLLADIYESKDVKQAYYYLQIAKNVNEELFGLKKIRDLQKTISEEQQRQIEIEAERIAYENELKLYSLLAGVGMLLLIATILYRNNRQKQKANAVLEKTLSTLRSTQAQLIQKEKLASLGELTAGIAHEIQNPLNFVNNFSELSIDLSQELKEEIDKSPLTPDGGIILKDKEYIDEILGDLTQNQEKINLHGKRASSIVKGMLEHSRTSTGERQLTDINQLADEYLRLSYHGLRAKDSSFNSEYELVGNESLPKIEVVPQEIGRVLLNLINNAFYAVNERAKQGEPNYQPKVTVSTQTTENQLQIRIKDNGTGIPENIKSKIFQPFFTTKPTGEGTGLGLSLAYDIVTKGHEGTLEVMSTEGIGTEFTIQLPI